MSDKAYVTELPVCQFCQSRGVTRQAHYDGKTLTGQWAYMCATDFANHGIGTGTGLGQELIVGEQPETTREQVLAAVEAGDYDLAEDLIGDRDPAEFL